MDGGLPNLHDAVLEGVHIDFAAGTAELDLRPPKPAKPCRVLIKGFRRASVDRDQPWGPSAYVMEVTSDPQQLDLLMQSGDHLLFSGPEMTVRVASS